MPCLTSGPLAKWLTLSDLVQLQLMRYEEQVEKYKQENGVLNESVGKSVTELARLEESLHQTELELTISQEKHRTCQQEVTFLCFSFAQE